MFSRSRVCNVITSTIKGRMKKYNLNVNAYCKGICNACNVCFRWFTFLLALVKMIILHYHTVPTTPIMTKPSVLYEVGVVLAVMPRPRASGSELI